MALVERSRRVVLSLVRDGTRLKIVIEGDSSGCYSVVVDLAREVVDGKRQSCYGVWLPDRSRV